MSNPEILQFKSPQELDAALSDVVAELLAEAVAAKGQALLVVSGGTTPVAFMRRLSQVDLPWAQVSVTLADERWVDVDEPASNERLVRENLLINKAQRARFVGLSRSDVSLDDAVVKAEQALADFATFDVLMLGMGQDGHTASLFPTAGNLAEGLDMASTRSCIGLHPSSAPYGRISMTLPRLLRSEQIFVHFTGADKRAVFDQALAERDAHRFPIASILCQGETPVTVFYAD